MYYEVIPIKLFRQDAGILTYSYSKNLAPGTLVTIPLGKLHTSGIILRKVKSVDFKTKPITSVLYSRPLPSHLLHALSWLADYYLTPLPTVARLMLPSGLGKVRRQPKQDPAPPAIKSTTIPLNSAQKRALKDLDAISTPTKLLHGVTGSGKTNIYLHLATSTLRAQKSTILLVPEIALTSQLVQVFEQTFSGRVIVLHSGQTEATRHRLWESILESDQPLIIIGPRSALFAPVSDLGLIIIDEAHEATYFQENTPRYSTLRLASVIAKFKNITCLQGTATPLVTDYYLAAHKHAVVTLSDRAKSTAITPQIKIIDFKNRDHFSKSRYFSNDLLSEISTNLKRHHQTLIYHNRRGSAPLTLCENCGWQALCPNCFLPLNLHTDTYELICHTCGHRQKIPTGCPECHRPGIIHKGFGTKLLETELKNLFKDATIARFDADNTRTETLSYNYQAVKDGEIDILIGTQTVAKGLDLPRLATVGVVQADSGLSLPDYAAEERTFHLLTQVLGRVGRGHLDSASAIIQTYQPDSPIIHAATRDDYAGFYHYLLKKRQKSHLPPFTHLAKLTITYRTEKTTLAHIKNLRQLLSLNPDIDVSPPTPAFHERTSQGYTWQLILKSTSRAKLLAACKFIPKNTNTHLTLDPPSLL